MFGLPNSWVLLGGAVLLVVTHGYVWVEGRKEGKNAVQVKWDAAKQAGLDEAERTRNEIQASIKVLSDKKDSDLADIQRKLSNAQRLLYLSRHERRDPNVAAPQCEGATGSDLARPDALFLEGYAATAGGLNTELTECRAAYESARTKLDALRGRLSAPASKGWFH